MLFYLNYFFINDKITIYGDYMKDDRYLLEKNNVLEDIRKRALEYKESVFNNPESTEEDKKTASDILEFVIVEDSFNKVPRSVVFNIFNFLGLDTPNYKISFFNQLYYKILDEVNKKYTFVDEESIKR